MSSKKKLVIRKILGSAEELTTEILRLLVLYPHNDETISKIGLSKEEIAARMCEILPGPGGVLTTADDGRRLQGLLHLEPVLPTSAALGAHVWRIGKLISAPEAPGDMVTAMLEESLAFLESPVDLITTRIPVTDTSATTGLLRSRFSVVSGEIVAVARNLKGTRTRRRNSCIVPFEARHIEAAARIACDCRQCNLFVDSDGLDPKRVCNLSRISLKPYVRANGQRGLVVLDKQKEVRGFAGFSLDAEFGGISAHKLASVDHLCVTADVDGLKLEALLGECILNELSKNRARAAIIRLLVKENQPERKMDSVKELGFEMTQSNLVLHRWLSKPPVQAA